MDEDLIKNTDNRIKKQEYLSIIKRYTCYGLPILVSIIFYYKTELMLLSASIVLCSTLMALVIAVNPFKEKVKYYKELRELTAQFRTIYKLFKGDISVNFNSIGNEISEIEPFFWKVLNFRPRIVNSKYIESGFIDYFRFRHDITFIAKLWKLTISNTEDKQQDIVLYDKLLNKSYSYTKPTENEDVRNGFLRYFADNVDSFAKKCIKSQISFLKYTNIYCGV